MRDSPVRSLLAMALILLPCGRVLAQSVVPASPGPSRIEPGLETAVNWKWRVGPSDKKEWGMPLPAALMPKDPGDPALKADKLPAPRPETYEVKKGDAIIKIARKFDMTPEQLKQFNDLKGDAIRIGEILRIPTPGDLLTMAPPPPAEPPKEGAGKKKSGKVVEVPTPDPEPSSEAQLELENVLLQVFLDREMFSPGVINGKSTATFLKICQIYQNSHPDAASPAMLKAKAQAGLQKPYTSYVLRADDFKFIQAPKEVPTATRTRQALSARKKSAKPDSPAPAPPRVMIDDLVGADFLGYTSAWELVAERFHCDEAFLRRINPQVKGAPLVGTEFQVPNVIPFEIETSLAPPLQPAANPQKPVTVAVVLVSRLEIFCDRKLIAVMPLASARPGLHGRGSWAMLDVIPQPRMGTRRELREIPKEVPASAGADVAGAQAVIEPVLDKEQWLAPGPNNPVGVLWINLAKAGSTDPLPYGLHGTSIPSQMGTLKGLGGLRLTNWDIVRAIRLIPAGTALQWKAQ